MQWPISSISGEGNRPERKRDWPQVRLAGGQEGALSCRSGGLGSNPSSATRSWVMQGKSFFLSGSNQLWFQAGSRGYLAGQGTEWGRIETFIGLEHVFLTMI